MSRTFLCKLFIPPLRTVFVYLFKSHSGFLHLWKRYGPALICRSKCNRALFDTHLPAFSEFWRRKLFYQRVNIGDDLHKSSLHLFRCYLQLIYKPINLVYEKNWFYPLFQSLSYNSLCLWHEPLDRIIEDHNAIYGSHGPCNFPAKIDVSGGVYEVYQIIRVVNVENHGDICGVYGYSPVLLLFIIIQKQLFPCHFFGYYSRSCYKRV